MRWLMGWSAWQFISFMISKKKVAFPESGIVLGTICIHTAGRRERLQRPQTANLKLLREGGFARAPRNRKPCQVDADCGACRTIYYREHHSLSKCTTYWGGEENVKRGRNPIIFLIFFTLEPRLRFSPRKKKKKQILQENQNEFQTLCPNACNKKHQTEIWANHYTFSRTILNN